MRNGVTATSVLEYPIYSDAHVIGEYADSTGPYHFLNTISVAKNDLIKTSITLRVFDYIGGFKPPDMSKKTTELYHGGGSVDEVVSLASLILGARLKAGGVSREIDLENDPMGKPRDSNYISAPYFVIDRDRVVLPDIRNKCDLRELNLLESIPVIHSSRYASLIKAARQYQEALWIAESSPNLAWLFLVTALEIAANDSIQVDKDYESQFRELKPQVVLRLEKTGDQELVKDIAEHFKDTVSVIKKFLLFIENFCPAEPPERPPNGLWKLDWTPKNIKKICEVVYKHRSKSLHTGTPFPRPMLEHATWVPETKIYAEVALTQNTKVSAGGGVWEPNDCPITLHAFHQLTRGLLLNWWKTMIPPPNPPENE